MTQLGDKSISNTAHLYYNWKAGIGCQQGNAARAKGQKFSTQRTQIPYRIWLDSKSKCPRKQGGEASSCFKYRSRNWNSVTEIIFYWPSIQTTQIHEEETRHHLSLGGVECQKISGYNLNDTAQLRTLESLMVLLILWVEALKPLMVCLDDFVRWSLDIHQVSQGNESQSRINMATISRTLIMCQTLFWKLYMHQRIHFRESSQ